MAYRNGTFRINLNLREKLLGFSLFILSYKSICFRIADQIASPIQTAGWKMPAFSFISKPFSEFGIAKTALVVLRCRRSMSRPVRAHSASAGAQCYVFKNAHLGKFYELVYAKVFIFQYVEWVQISLSCWGCFFIRTDGLLNLAERFWLCLCKFCDIIKLYSKLL